MKIRLSSQPVEELEHLLSCRTPTKIASKRNSIEAAVMIILKETKEGFSLLFIKRPENAQDTFSGHMAFPGGKVKCSDDTKLATAMRETYEEIGIDLNKNGRFIGILDDINPNTPRANHYIVTPYISILEEGIILKPSRDEVEVAVWIPVSSLIGSKNCRIRMRVREGKKIEDYVYNYKQYIIWGMTGRIVRNFLSLSAGVL